MYPTPARTVMVFVKELYAHYPGIIINTETGDQEPPLCDIQVLGIMHPKCQER